MKVWAKGGLIGFVVVFIGLLIILLLTGHDDNGWKCTGVEGSEYCPFAKFIFAPIHISFILFFSWVGFIGGVVNIRIINKMIKEKGNDRRIHLKITQAIVLTLVIVFAVIGMLAFENWVNVMLYAVIFIIFVIFLGWIIEKKKYG